MVWWAGQLFGDGHCPKSTRPFPPQCSTVWKVTLTVVAVAEEGGGQKEIKETLSSWLRHKHLINKIILGVRGQNELLNYNNPNLVSCCILIY